MNQIYSESGGRPRKTDDLLLLQSEVAKVQQSFFKGFGAVIINGCNVIGSGPYTISDGLVFIDNLFLEFDGVSVSGFPYYVYQNTPVLQEYLPYKDNVSRATRQLFKAIGSTSPPSSGQYITFTISGGKKWSENQTAFVSTTGTQTVNGNKTFTGNETFSGFNNFTNSNTFTGSISILTSGNINTAGNITGNSFIANTNFNANSHKMVNLADGSVATDAVAYHQLTDEITNRSNADSSLSSSISTVSGNLSTETTNRINADNALQSNINNKADKNQGAWTNMPITSGTTSGYNIPQYRIDQFGNIELRGSLSGTTSLNGTYSFIILPICNLASVPTDIKNAINANAYMTNKYINVVHNVTFGVFVEVNVPASFHIDTSFFGINATLGFLPSLVVSSATTYSYIINLDGITMNIVG